MAAKPAFTRLSPRNKNVSRKTRHLYLGKLISRPSQYIVGVVILAVGVLSVAPCLK